MSARLASVLALAASLLTVSLAFADPEPKATATATATATPTAPMTAAPPAPAPAPAWLAPSPPVAAIGKPEAPRSSWRSILVLLAVAGIGGAAYYAKRKKRMPVVVPEESRLHVVESVRVSPHAQVVLTSVNGRLLLLGVTDRSVHRIAWVGRTAAPAPPAARENVPAAKAAPTAAPRPFQAMLNALRNGARNDARDESPSVSPALQIAEETVDTYERRAPANTNRVSSAPPEATLALRSIEALVAAPMEGQVSGLRRRAAKRKS